MKPFLAAAFAAALAFPAGAEPLSPVKTAQLSAALYATGVEMGDPLLILSAAKLRKTLNPAKGSLLAEGATPVDDAPLGWEEMQAKDATDLNLTVYDAQGRLVCSDTDKSHIAYCGWRPDQTGGFVMKVENNGPQGANYALMTN